MPETDSDKLPKHVGIILDGNRRWAEEVGMPRLEGHRVGAEVLKQVADHLVDRGVKYLTTYVFSTENWKRGDEEVGYLMKKILPFMFKKHLQYFIDKGIRIHWLGSQQKLGKAEKELMQNAVEKTKHLDKAHLGLCFNYGGHQEIVDACKALIRDNVQPDDLTVDKFREYIYSPDMPDIDLIIRTSGEMRLSNFALWRAAYSEFISTKTKWPAMTINEIDEILEEFARRQRRFGS